MRVQGVVNGTVWLVEDVRAEAERWRGYEMGSVVVPGHESCTFGWLLWSKSVGTPCIIPRFSFPTTTKVLLFQSRLSFIKRSRADGNTAKTMAQLASCSKRQKRCLLG